MKCEKTKGIVCTVVSVLVALFLVALGFFAYATTQNLAAWGVGAQNSYNLGQQAGQQTAILAVIERTADTEKCEAINLFAGEGENRVEVNLINTACVAQTEATTEEASEESEK